MVCLVNLALLTRATVVIHTHVLISLDASPGGPPTKVLQRD
jgi:hypothetical protein